MAGSETEEMPVLCVPVLRCLGNLWKGEGFACLKHVCKTCILLCCVPPTTSCLSRNLSSTNITHEKLVPFFSGMLLLKIFWSSVKSLRVKVSASCNEVSSWLGQLASLGCGSSSTKQKKTCRLILILKSRPVIAVFIIKPSVRQAHG